MTRRKAMAYMTMNDMNEKIMNLTDEQMEQVAGGTESNNIYCQIYSYLDKAIRDYKRCLPIEEHRELFVELLRASDALRANCPDEAIQALREAYEASMNIKSEGQRTLLSEEILWCIQQVKWRRDVG